MSRTIGAKDIGRRSQRSDKGKRHKTYRGKTLPKKRVKRIKFTSQRGHKTHLKVWIWGRKKMSKQGLQNWSPRLRGSVNKKITKFGDRINAPVEELSNRENLEQWSLDNIMKPGEFYVMSLTGTPKTKTKVKWIKLFKVVITEADGGLVVRITKLYSIFRYWFWMGGKK